MYNIAEIFKKLGAKNVKIAFNFLPDISSRENVEQIEALFLEMLTVF